MSDSHDNASLCYCYIVHVPELIPGYVNVYLTLNSAVPMFICFVSHLFCHLGCFKMLNDDKCNATRISKENKFELHFQVILVF